MLKITQAARPLADHWMASLSFLFLQDFCSALTALVRVLSSLFASVYLSLQQWHTATGRPRPLGERGRDFRPKNVLVKEQMRPFVR